MTRISSGWTLVLEKVLWPAGSQGAMREYRDSLDDDSVMLILRFTPPLQPECRAWFIGVPNEGWSLCAACPFPLNPYEQIQRASWPPPLQIQLETR